MQSEFESAHWFRVAELKPRLRSQALVEPRYYRGELWYVLRDQFSSRHFRFTPLTWYLLSHMDGIRSLQDIWDAAVAQHGEERVPTQEELIALLGRLHSIDLLHCDVPPDAEELFRRYQNAQTSGGKRRYLNPMSLRWSLIDPETILQKLLPVARPLFSRRAAVLWALVVLSALVLAISHWGELSGHILDTTLTPQNWLLLWLVFPLVKALHELGHAFATKVWGGEVHSMGVAFLVLTPVPFVDASASSAFPEKSRRLLVSAAGMMVELFLASLALFLWLLVEPGMIRDIAAVVMFIAGISTVLFNANPLLKFDGYYMLVDALEIPNLSSRSSAFYAYLVQRYGFGLREIHSPASSTGERAWFACYGMAAFAYRLVIAVSICIFIAGKFFIFGVLLAMWVAVSMLVLPLIKMGVFLVSSPRIAQHRSRAVTLSSAAVMLLLAFVFFLPLPFWTRVDGVISVPESGQIRAGVAGDIKSVLVAPGQYVDADTALIVSEDPFLSYQVKILAAEEAELKRRYSAALSSDRVQAEIMSEELQSKRAELEKAERLVGEQTLAAPVSGMFIAPGVQDLPGNYVEKGQLLAYVVQPEDTRVSVVLTQADIALVRAETKGVQVLFSSQIYEPVTAQVQREVPAANFKLPSAVLGSLGGGDIQVDAADTEGLRTQQQTFQLELAFLEQVPAVYFGERVQVRFDHGRASLARQWYRRGRQLFLRSFGV